MAIPYYGQSAGPLQRPMAGPMAGPLQRPVPSFTTDPNFNHLNSEQQQNVRTIIATGKALGMGDNAIISALAAANDESTFQMYASSKIPESFNYPHSMVGSDGMSVGLFQQQQGFGYGNVAQMMDPVLSTMTYFGASKFQSADGMMQINGWQQLAASDPGHLAQLIQKSGTGDRYRQFVNVAQSYMSTMGASVAPIKLPVAPRMMGPNPVAAPAAMATPTAYRPPSATAASNTSQMGPVNPNTLVGTMPAHGTRAMGVTYGTQSNRPQIKPPASPKSAPPASATSFMGNPNIKPKPAPKPKAAKPAPPASSTGFMGNPNKAKGKVSGQSPQARPAPPASATGNMGNPNVATPRPAPPASATRK